jgi:hypothetical protein
VIDFPHSKDRKPVGCCNSRANCNIINRAAGVGNESNDTNTDCLRKEWDDDDDDNNNNMRMIIIIIIIIIM